jgi:hypothetical protein
MHLKLECEDGQDVNIGFGDGRSAISIVASDVNGHVPIFTIEEAQVIVSMIETAMIHATKERDELEANNGD